MTTNNYRDVLAERLAAVAIELVSRVRDERPDANQAWLVGQLPDPADREALLFVLAAAVPTDRSWRMLTAWTVVDTGPRELRPCGTIAAARRHRDRGEPLDEACREEELTQERIRGRLRRAAA